MLGSFWEASLRVIQPQQGTLKSHPVYPNLCHVFADFKVLHDAALVQELEIWHRAGEGSGSAVSHRNCNQIFLVFEKTQTKPQLLQMWSVELG